MSVYTSQLHRAPSGMSDADPAGMPENRCQYIQGFTPARQSRMELAPLIKKMARGFGFTIYGTAVYLSADGTHDKLLFVNGSNVVTLPLWAVYQYDERVDGQHSSYDYGVTGFGSLTNHGIPGPMYVTSLQFKAELVLSIGGALFRYYVNSGGTEFFYTLGLFQMTAPTTGTQTTGGAMTIGGVYSYVTTSVDEFGRESSPSDPVTTTLTASNNKLTVTRGTSSSITNSIGGVVSWNVYRKNPSATTYNFVATIAIATTTYVDGNSDVVVAAGDVAPSEGENDPPGTNIAPYTGPATIMEFWKDRLVINNTQNPSEIQISNANSPTQFSSLDLPDNAGDGLRILVGGKGDNEVTGLANLGSLLAVFKRQTISLLYGDDSSTFILRPAHERGCQNAGSVQRCENDVFFLSDDGIYSLGYENGYALKKISEELDSLFRGFAPIKQSGEAISTGQPQSIQVVSAVLGNVTTFYSEDRYYISFMDKTLCYCMQANGWSDTGWGFLKTASRYLAQLASYALGAPESIFITRAGITSNADFLEYYTVTGTPLDRDAPSSVPSRYVTRPFDGDGPPENRTKRPGMFIQYGQTSARRGQRIGTIRGYADGHLVEAWPIYAWSNIKKHGSLFEQSWSPSMKGEVVWAELEFTITDLSLGDSILEYTFLS